MGPKKRSKTKLKAGAVIPHPASQPEPLNSDRSSLRSIFVALFLIFMVALAVRLTYVYQQSIYNPFFYHPAMDEEFHDQWAQTIVEGKHFMPGQPYFRAPLYPYFLAMLYSLMSRDFFWIRLCQSFLGALSCVLVFGVARQVCSYGASLTAGLICALYGVLIYFEALLLIPVLIIFLDLLFLYLWGRALNHDSQTYCWALAGICFGLSAIARPNILLVGPLVFVSWFQWSKIGEKSRKKAFTGLLLFGIALMLVIAPVTARNYIVSRELVLIASQGGVNYYIGNNPKSDGKTAIVPGTRPDWWGGYEDTRTIARQELGKDPSDSEISRYWYRKAFAFIRQNPVKWLRLMGYKILYLFGSHELSNNYSVPFYAGYAPIYHYLPLSFGVLAPLGMTGLLMLFRKKQFSYIFPSFFVVYAFSIILFFVTARYRMPLIPILAVGAAVFLDLLHGWWQRSEYKKLIIPLLVLGLMFALVHHPLQPGYDKAQDHYSLAVFLYGQERLEEAIKEYQKALEINKKWDLPAYNLGYMLEGQQEYELSQKYYREALNRNKNCWQAAYQLCRINLRNQNYQQALEYANQAVTARPIESKAYYVRGHCLMALGQFKEAGQSFRSALQFNPEQVEAKIYLAVSMLEQNLADPGIKLLKDVLDEDPNNELAQRFLTMANQQSESQP